MLLVVVLIGKPTHTHSTSCFDTGIRITRGILNEHLTKCDYTLVECDGYKQFMDYIDNLKKSPSYSKNSTSNNSAAPAPSSSTNGVSLNSSRSSGSLTNSNSNKNGQNSDNISSSPPSSPHVKSSTPNILEWSENTIKLARPCEKVLRKDLADHKANHCLFR
jgi:hypothetical protein